MTVLIGLFAILAQIASAVAPIPGVASWYDYRPRQAAAGPALREALGPSWRGQVVTVCAATCTKVRLTDWCQCYKGQRRERIIDLDRRSFVVLGVLPSRGIAKVKIYP